MKDGTLDTTTAAGARRMVALAIGEKVENLYFRWQDEREYEDFADYQAAARTWVEEAGAAFVSMTARPFRVVFRIGGETGFVKVTSRAVEWGKLGGSK